MNRESLTADIADAPGGAAAARDMPVGADGRVRPTNGSLVGFWCVAATILTSSTIAYLRLRDSFTFYMDDFLQLDVASRTGLSRELLMLDVFQHFAPINRLGHLFMLDTLNLDPRAGAVVAAGLIACVLAATAWLTFELGMSLLRRCLVLVACGGSLSFLDSAVWNDAAWHILGALTATYLVAALHLRAVRTGKNWWHVASVVAFAIGLLTQERAAFALPMIVLIDVFLVWQGAPLRVRTRKLWALRVPLLAMATLGVLAAAYIKANYGGSGGPGIGLTVKTVLLALTSYQFPQLAVIAPVNPIAVPAQLAVLVLIGVVFVGLIALNRANSGPILFFSASFLLYWGFLAFSPLLTAENVVSTAARLHNSAYLVVPAYIAVFSLRLRGDNAPELALSPRARVFGGIGLVVALLAYVTTMGGVFIKETWGWQTAGHTYLANVRAEKASWMDPGLTVIPMLAPDSVVQQWATSFGRPDHLLALLQPGWTPGDVTDRLAFFGPDGHLVDASLQELGVARPVDPPYFPDSTTSPAAGTSCLSPSTGEDALGFELNQPITGAAPLLAEVSYTSDMTGKLVTQSVSTTGVASNIDMAYPFRAGTHTALMPLAPSAETIGAVNLIGLPTGVNLCVSALSVVRPLLAQPDGSCWVVDAYGTRTNPPISAPCSPEPGA